MGEPTVFVLPPENVIKAKGLIFSELQRIKQHIDNRYEAINKRLEHYNPVSIDDFKDVQQDLLLLNIHLSKINSDIVEQDIQIGVIEKDMGEVDDFMAGADEIFRIVVNLVSVQTKAINAIGQIVLKSLKDK